jgi:hypothetical protein
MKTILYCRVSTLDQTLDHQRVQAEQAGLKPDLVAGKFSTLVIDPPWDYQQWHGGRAGLTYETMSHHELLALPVPTWAASDCHLYLWTTNAFMPQAVELIAADLCTRRF